MHSELWLNQFSLYILGHNTVFVNYEDERWVVSTTPTLSMPHELLENERGLSPYFKYNTYTQEIGAERRSCRHHRKKMYIISRKLKFTGMVGLRVAVPFFVPFFPFFLQKQISCDI